MVSTDGAGVYTGAEKGAGVRDGSSGVYTGAEAGAKTGGSGVDTGGEPRRGPEDGRPEGGLVHTAAGYEDQVLLSTDAEESSPGGEMPTPVAAAAYEDGIEMDK